MSCNFEMTINENVIKQTEQARTQKAADVIKQTEQARTQKAAELISGVRKDTERGRADMRA